MEINQRVKFKEAWLRQSPEIYRCSGTIISINKKERLSTEVKFDSGYTLFVNLNTLEKVVEMELVDKIESLTMYTNILDYFTREELKEIISALKAKDAAIPIIKYIAEQIASNEVDYSRKIEPIAKIPELGMNDQPSYVSKDKMILKAREFISNFT